MSIVAVNCAYILPVSTRAIPVSCGLNPAHLFSYGIKLAILNAAVNTALGWLAINYWDLFSVL